MDTNEQMNQVVVWIMEATEDLRNRYGLLLDAGMDVKALREVERAARRGAERWARALLDPDDDTAPEVACDVIWAIQGRQALDPDPKLRGDPKFWRTPLGQILIGHGALPDPLKRTEAAAALGISVAAVRQASERGSLLAYRAGTLVTRESVMIRWRQKRLG